VWLVSGADRTPQALSGALPAARLAAAGSLVALMPYSLPSPVNHFPSVQNSVEIWNAASAGRQTNVTPPGAVRDLALNSAMLVVLTIDAKGARVIRYDTHGAKLRSSESHSAPPTSPTRSATGSWNSTWLPATCVVYTRHSWPQRA